MASELQPNEEGMTEILQTNDSLIRVLEYYKRIIKPNEEGAGHDQPTDTPQLPSASAFGAIGGSSAEKKPDSPTGADLLLDLSDLNFGTPISNGTTASSDGSVATATGFLGDLNILGRIRN